METIRNYLETMFVHLPNTNEVKKAKHELYQMMEDKYNELLANGKSENEATGIVIAEFGNLDELAETLGIDQYVNSGDYVKGEELNLSTVKEYIADASKHSIKIALGVLLCIICSVPAIVTSGIGEMSNREDFYDAIGCSLLFLVLVVGIGLIIYSNVKFEKWKYLKNKDLYLDFATTKYVSEQQAQYRTTYAALLTIGIALCVMCAVPAIILDGIFDGANPFIENVMGAFVLGFIGLGVFLIIIASEKMDVYKKLLKLNGTESVGGHYDESQEEDIYYENDFVRALMSVYWPTITCLYLICSFLTFSWGITWIIWPIACVVRMFINNMWGKDNK